MAQVAVLSQDSRIEEALRATGFRTSAVPAGGLSSVTRTDQPVAALVVDVRGQQVLPTGLAAFSRQHPQTGIVVVVSALDPRLMLEAMRAGASECVPEPLTPQALEEAVRRVIVQGDPEPAGRVIAFVGAKGGVGATTIAANTAAALARTVTGDVLLVDLHIGAGDAALFLGAEPRFSVLDAAENVHRLDTSYLKGIVEKTKSGVDVLGTADRVPQGPMDAQRLRKVIEIASHTYRFTVLDVPRADRMALDALDAAASIVVVASQDVSALRSAGRLAHALRTRYGKPRVRAVISRLDRNAEIAHADVERVIGDAVSHEVPSDYRAAVEALNAGRPVVLGDGRLAESLRALAAVLGGMSKPTKERPAGMLGRLVFRKA